MSRGIIGVTVGTPISPKAIERKIKPVKSVNGVTPDENGNVAVDTMDEQAVQHLVENTVRAIDPVLSVNGVEPDENGNVNIEGGTGEDGFSPVAKVTQTDTGAVISITDKSGTTTATLANGKDGVNGKDGADGTNGADGVGIKSVAQTTTSAADDGNNVITVTLTNGTKSTFKVQNGSKGSKGDKGDTGEQGIQGIQGEKGETGADGKDGEPGKDGSARVLLWDNQHPRSFGAESIPLDLSGYDGIEVLFYEYDDSVDNAIISSGYIPLDFRYKSDGSAYPLYGQGTLTRGFATYYRCFYVHPTGIDFEVANVFDDGNPSLVPAYIIPYRIYGFKNCECDGIGSGGSGGDVSNLGALAYKDKVGSDDLDANLSYVVNDRVSQAEYAAAMQDIADAIESLEKEVADRVIYNEFIGAMTDIDYRKVDAQFKQTYTEEEKALARANIGATTVAEVLAALPIYNGEVETV